jgi:hypothetical protein
MHLPFILKLDSLCLQVPEEGDVGTDDEPSRYRNCHRRLQVDGRLLRERRKCQQGKHAGSNGE